MPQLHVYGFDLVTCVALELHQESIDGAELLLGATLVVESRAQRSDKCRTSRGVHLATSSTHALQQSPITGHSVDSCGSLTANRPRQ